MSIAENAARTKTANKTAVNFFMPASCFLKI
jgi:hypothetical protein